MTVSTSPQIFLHLYGTRRRVALVVLSFPMAGPITRWWPTSGSGNQRAEILPAGDPYLASSRPAYGGRSDVPSTVPASGRTEPAYNLFALSLARRPARPPAWPAFPETAHSSELEKHLQRIISRSEPGGGGGGGGGGVVKCKFVRRAPRRPLWCKVPTW